MCDCPRIQGQYNSKFGVSFFQKEESAYHDVYWENGKRENGDIWLPRQDQIQEMIGNFRETMEKFWAFLADYSYYEAEFDEDKLCLYSSMEQLWLTFYMWEKHKLAWSTEGEKWIKK